MVVNQCDLLSYESCIEIRVIYKGDKLYLFTSLVYIRWTGVIMMNINIDSLIVDLKSEL